MAKTRNSKAVSKAVVVKTAADAVAAASSTIAKVTLCPEDQSPPMPFVLPRDMSADSRIFTLADQRNPLLETRYMCCPEKGFFRFIKTAAPSSMKSWLVVPAETKAEGSKNERESSHGPAGELLNDLKISNQEEEETSKFGIEKSYVVKARDMFIATPIDPLFLILPALAPVPTKTTDPEKHLFLSIDDYFDRLTTGWPQIGCMLQFPGTRRRLESRIAAVCDFVDAGDEKMYRFENGKLLQEIWSKAKIMVELGLPSSMEDKFITQPLFNPITGNKFEETLASEDSESGKISSGSGAATPATDMVDSQAMASSTASLSTSESSISTDATSISDVNTQEPVQSGQLKLSIKSPEEGDKTPEEVINLLRLRTSINFISSSYLPPHLQKAITEQLQDPQRSPQDFQQLDTHLEFLARIRKDLAARSVSDYSRKRPLDDDEAETRAEKKAKLAEEEKRKRAGESRGVKNLKKVDVTGMKKMSDFFKKK